MLFKHKKPTYDKLTLFEEFSDDILQYSLESLTWSSSLPRGSREIQTIKLKSIPHSILTERMFAILFTEKFKLGNFIYERIGNRIERHDPNIRVEKEERKPFTISKPFHVMVDIDQDQGVVTKIV